MFEGSSTSQYITESGSLKRHICFLQYWMMDSVWFRWYKHAVLKMSMWIFHKSIGYTKPIILPYLPTECTGIYTM